MYTCTLQQSYAFSVVSLDRVRAVPRQSAQLILGIMLYPELTEKGVLISAVINTDLETIIIINILLLSHGHIFGMKQSTCHVDVIPIISMLP